MSLYLITETTVPHVLCLEPAGIIDGRALWDYELYCGSALVFAGSDLSTHSLRSDDEAASDAVAILALREPDDDYTDTQRAWCSDHADELALCAAEPDESGLSVYRIIE